MENSSLKSLKLPSGFNAAGAWLNDLAAKYPSIEHLTLSTPYERITTDPCEDPFENFVKLKSLSLELAGYNMVFVISKYNLKEAFFSFWISSHLKKASCMKDIGSLL